MIVFAVFVALIFLTGLVGRRLETTIITTPMIFALAGLALSFLVPSLTRIEIRDPVVLLTTEITLAALLFTDGSRIDVRGALGGFSIPARLLGIGMPLTILAGVGAAAALFPGLGLWEAAILATILAPTDAGLGQVVVNSPLVPQRIREALDVEAGLNDGLSVPFLMLFISLARAEQPFSHQSWVLFAVQLIGVGVLSGVVLGRVGGRLIEVAQRRGLDRTAVAPIGPAGAGYPRLACCGSQRRKRVHRCFRRRAQREDRVRRRRGPHVRVQ